MSSSGFQYIVQPSVIVQARFANGVWTATLNAEIYDRNLTGLSVQGPNSSLLKVYLGNVDPQNLIDQTRRGQSNTADYSGGPRKIPRGQFVTIQWTPLGSGTFTGTETVSATFFQAQG